MVQYIIEVYFADICLYRYISIVAELLVYLIFSKISISVLFECNKSQ